VTVSGGDVETTTLTLPDSYPWLESDPVADVSVKSTKYKYEHEHCQDRPCQGNYYSQEYTDF
jgi:hypothetical protein